MSEFDDSPVTDDFRTTSGMLFPESRSHALDMIVNIFLENNTIDAFSNVDDIVNQVVGMAKKEFCTYNANMPQGSKMTVPVDLTPAMISKIMLQMYCIRNINCAGVASKEEYDILGVYQEDGPDKGIYISKEYKIRNMIREFNSELTEEQIKHTINLLKIKAPRVERCSDPDLIAINNGIFNYKTKIVEPFDPEKVFTAKCRVNYNPTATNIVIHNDDGTDWDIESWVLELFDDPEIAECIWQIMGAVIRPNIRWGKAAWFVSQKGNNGKGTLCHLMRNLAGNNSYAAIKLSDFGKDFMLEPFTNDVIQMNRKFKVPIAFQFKGFMVQCVNEMPRTKDKSESFYRRSLFIPFTKCYTGIERKYIKDDYLNRPEVLEYVLYRILNMNYYEISEPEACKKALEEYKVFNDPVKDFLLEIKEEASWDCIPSQLLYDMYKGWSKINNPNGSIQGRNTFLNDVKSSIGYVSGWYYVDSKSAMRVSGRMDCDEPLLAEYNCTDWMDNPKTEDGRVKIKPIKKKDRVGGIFKDDCTAGIDPDTDDTDNSN